MYFLWNNLRFSEKTSVNKREVINESEMPAFLRRKAISEEECAAINVCFFSFL